ncbi:4103_t:CDS:2, partial [Dentiscutata erythropus]
TQQPKSQQHYATLACEVIICLDLEHSKAIKTLLLNLNEDERALISPRDWIDNASQKRKLDFTNESNLLTPLLIRTQLHKCAKFVASFIQKCFLRNYKTFSLLPTPPQPSARQLEDERKEECICAVSSMMGSHTQSWHGWCESNSFFAGLVGLTEDKRSYLVFCMSPDGNVVHCEHPWEKIDSGNTLPGC